MNEIPIHTFNCDPIEGIFLERPNRFIGYVLVGNKKEIVHVHDPGRVPLLRPNTKVLLCPTNRKGRKTKYDLIAFWYGEWVFSHSGYHSYFFEETLKKVNLLPHSQIRREVRVGDSRIDFLINDNLYVEIKGCTWIINDHCFFPDAPTERGRRHIRHLARICEMGGRARVYFLVFHTMIRSVGIAKSVDPKFYDLFIEATNAGVIFEGLKYRFDGKTLYFVGRIPVDPQVTT